MKQGEDGVPVAEICRKAGISQATDFNWKKKYGGLLSTEMRRLKQLEDENARLKKIVADLSLDKELGMQLRNKTPKRRVKAKLREDREEATSANETWAMDFVHDQLATGRTLRILTVVDTFPATRR